MKKIIKIFVIILTIVFTTNSNVVFAQNNELQLNTDVLNGKNNANVSKPADNSPLFSNGFNRQNKINNNKTQNINKNINILLLTKKFKDQEKNRLLAQNLFTKPVLTPNVVNPQESKNEIYIGIVIIILTVAVVFLTLKNYKKKGNANAN